MKRALFPLLVLLFAACGKTAPPPKAQEDAATPPAPTTACDARLNDIDHVIASATNKCTTDKDCVCYRGGVSVSNPCGGITDAKTNERFEALAKESAAAGCKPPNVMCAAILCEPRCNAGTCGPKQVIQ